MLPHCLSDFGVTGFFMLGNSKQFKPRYISFRGKIIQSGLLWKTGIYRGVNFSWKIFTYRNLANYLWTHFYELLGYSLYGIVYYYIKQ